MPRLHDVLGRALRCVKASETLSGAQVWSEKGAWRERVREREAESPRLYAVIP